LLVTNTAAVPAAAAVRNSLLLWARFINTISLSRLAAYCVTQDTRRGVHDYVTTIQPGLESKNVRFSVNALLWISLR